MSEYSPRSGVGLWADLSNDWDLENLSDEDFRAEVINGLSQNMWCAQWMPEVEEAVDKRVDQIRREAQLDVLHRLRWQSLHAGDLKDFTAMIDAAAKEIGEQG